ncbi:MAG TPA: uroporphyrinogen decarboxylase [Phycisphaerae bacterium]|nr:uroporphyrinogen decarboxylase [Phycisphaerae bacterium]
MTKGFDGLRVVTFDGRLADRMSRLIEKLGGVAVCASAVRDLPIPQSPDAAIFADDLLAGRYDTLILPSGRGAHALLAILERHRPRAALREALSKTSILARCHRAVGALREWRLSPSIAFAEADCWRSVLAAIEDRGPLTGKRIAIEASADAMKELAAALRDRGVDVAEIQVHTQALPEDLMPLREAIEALCAGRVEVALFTGAMQVCHLLHVAEQMGKAALLAEATKWAVIGSVGLGTSEALHRAGLGVDFEPDRPLKCHLVRQLARRSGYLLRRKRASAAAGIEVNRARRIDLLWDHRECGAVCDPLHDSAFLRACRREATPYSPIWIMRQAGRYQRAYRELRAKHSFLEMCKTPELAAEVTLMAVDQLGVDAAIIFADILLIVEPMGVGLSFIEGEGPAITRPVRSGAEVDTLRDVHSQESLGFVMEAIRLTRRALHPSIPLIGFCGAPFTVASYMIEGSSSRDFRETKTFMYRDAGAWHALMGRLVAAHTGYINAQIDAGVQAVQIFDSWVGCLSESDYHEFVLPHVQKLIHSIKPGIPIIHFGTNTATLLKQLKEAGGDVIGLDWRMNLAETWADLGYDVAVQGNLDPVVLFSSIRQIRARAKVVLDQAAGRPGHIFNLGHGILPGTPVDHVLALVDFVHEYSAAQRGRPECHAQR